MNITIEGVSKIYKGRTTALDDVSLELKPGLFGLIGRNGAGKTTLMRILATVLEPTVGTIRFDGKDIRQHKLEYRSSLGYLPQNTRLIPHMNIVEFLDYMCVLKGIRDGAARKREIERCTQLVGLEKEGKKPCPNIREGCSAGRESRRPCWEIRHSLSSTNRQPGWIRRNNCTFSISCPG